MTWVVHVARTGERGGVYRILVGKPETKRPLGRSRLTIIIIIIINLIVGKTEAKRPLGRPRLM